MKKMISLSTVLVLPAVLTASVLILTACASTRVKPEAESVVVSQNPAPAGCKKIGEVESHTHVNIANRSENILVNLLKNNAYDLGGNYVVLTDAGKLKHTGDVYSCP